MNTEDPEKNLDNYTKTLSINLFGQLLLITTVSWASECRLLSSLQTAQAALHTIALLLVLGSTAVNLFTVYCARIMRNMEGFEALAELSFRSVGLLTLLQLSMFFLTPAPIKLIFIALSVAMLVRWSLAKGKFLWPSDFTN